MKVWMIRHPQTTANRDKIIYGHRDYPYTMRGKQQKKTVIEWAKTARQSYAKDWSFNIITSPRGRAKVLAMDLAEALEAEVTEDERLTEMSFGCLEGLTYEEVKVKYPKVYEDFYHHFDTMQIPEGESYQAFITRLEGFYKEWLSEGKGKAKRDTDCLILVTHGAVMRHFMEKMLRLNPGDSWKFKIINGTIIQYEWNQDWSIEGMIPCKITEDKA